MSKPEWGNKRICLTCGARFYDLCRLPVVCPKCEAEFDPEPLLKSRRPRSRAADRVESKKKAAAANGGAGDDRNGLRDIEDNKKSAAEEPTEDDLVESDLGDKGNEFIEDASELGEDEDDMAEVVIDEQVKDS